jgi:hypothetical protein
MCPLCVGTALALWGGTSSAGGVAAIALKSIRRRGHASSSRRASESLPQVIDDSHANVNETRAPVRRQAKH